MRSSGLSERSSDLTVTFTGRSLPVTAIADSPTLQAPVANRQDRHVPLVGDTAWGTAPMLAWMVDQKGTAPHMPVWDKTARTDATFPGSMFEWNARAGHYIYPAGHVLRSE
jgi:hypothetical protein